MKYTAPLLAIVLLFLFATAANAADGSVKPTLDWDGVSRAAAAEGQVTVYATSGFEPVFENFQKRFPAIKLNPVVGRGNQLAQKILAERRAGKFLADVYLGGIGTPYNMFYRGGLLDPIEPLLVLAENLDRGKWFQGKYHYADDDGKYLFVFEMALRSDVVYSTQLVRPEEINSYWNFVEPKWKGKIAAIDPHVTGVATSSSLSFLYYHPELGPEYLRKLFGQMELTFSRDPRQMLDWLAVGKFSLAFFASDADQAVKQGLPIGRFLPTAFKEGVYGRPQRGTVSIFQRAPHPNAAVVFINWLLSRDGQSVFQKAFAEDFSLSAREDVSKDHLPAAYRLTKGGKFFPAYRPEFIDTKPAIKVIDEALKK
jgi:iron(III) transport system substrate-binding protein